MGWKLKRNIFGINFDLDFETKLPRQEMYDLRLKLNWGSNKNKNSDQSKDFIYYALCHLPQGSFIIFSFDKAGEYFIQFANIGGNIVLDIPLLAKNIYSDKGTEIIELLQSMKLERIDNKDKSSLPSMNKFLIIRKGNKNKIIRASFGEFHIWAGVTAVLITEDIFKINDLHLFNFETARLIAATASEENSF